MIVFLGTSLVTFDIASNELALFAALLTPGMSPLVAWYLDREYLQALPSTKEDTQKYFRSLFVIRVYFMFAWVIPHVVLLFVLLLYRESNSILVLAKALREKFYETSGWG